ncbi:MAG: hypothetical protein ETSY2_24225 [Candidatus Entotheonella gemina]|uniref:Uncharacterized protein n=1 Tax=Candidatus Entotheonella gemina TaxID=1429439 RepID=W4M4E2_9BACT|nr:MAG: hypothetical protein ETSY2_24225 [Candidatus Entotheonella gemina]
MTLYSSCLRPECSDILLHLPDHVRHGKAHVGRELTADIKLLALNALDHEV